MVTHSMENILGMQYYAPPVDEPVHSPPRKKRCMTKEQDPMSHRIIEKRRRDRMNNCLADLSRLIPAEYLKKGRGRVEKTEIIEMAIRHMKHLQGLRQDSKHHPPTPSVHTVHGDDSIDSMSHSPTNSSSAAEHYRLGFHECLSETLHFLVEIEGFFARDALCVQLIQHLQQHCDKIIAASDRLGFPHPVDLPNINISNCNGSGVTSFAHTVNGSLPSPCSNNLTSNGLNNNVNNNSHHANQSNQHNSSHQSMHSSSNSSDRFSSSGVSSFDPSESRVQRPLVPPPSLVSDDSNHSSHSSGLMVNGPNPSHQHLHHNQESNPRPPTNYKFKNSIKQRFSADQRIKTFSSSPPPSCSGSSTESSPKHSSHGVPIFALHDNGGFYIPLTVEASLLRSHVGCTAGDFSPETVLHPVTISVNFNSSSQTIWNPQNSPPHQIQ